MDSNEGNFIAILRGHGLQVTHQRLAIYQELYNSMDQHPDAEMIYQEVKKRFPMISLGTVYKTLERFSDVGLVQKVSPTTEVARYDIEVKPHYHLICLECQRIVNVDQSVVSEAIDLPHYPGFQVLSYQLVFQGYCPTCQNEHNE
jgi:Fur family peroxide stress response transcriptional regulator